jgi:hypothetical protein
METWTKEVLVVPRLCRPARRMGIAPLGSGGRQAAVAPVVSRQYAVLDYRCIIRQALGSARARRHALECSDRS